MTPPKGERHPLWKGTEASYNTIHRWLQRNYPKTGVCARCWKRRKTDYAFLHYPLPHTRDIRDYIELCPSCHITYDYLTGQREEKSRQALLCSHGHGPKRRLPSGRWYCRECNRLERERQRRKAGIPARVVI
jgi:hypothetical protein